MKIFKTAAPLNDPVNDPVNDPLNDPVNDPVNDTVNDQDVFRSTASRSFSRHSFGSESIQDGVGRLRDQPGESSTGANMSPSVALKPDVACSEVHWGLKSAISKRDNLNRDML